MARGETSQEDDDEVLLVPVGAQFFCIHHGRFFRQRNGFLTHLNSLAHPRVKARCERCYIALGSKKAVERHQNGRGSHSLPFSTKWIKWDDTWIDFWRGYGVDGAVIDACAAGNVGEFFECVNADDQEDATPIKMVRVMLCTDGGQDIIPKPGIMGI